MIRDVGGADSWFEAERALQTRRQMSEIVSRTLRATAPTLFPTARCTRSHLYAVLAFDWAVDTAGGLCLLEVNSHPAIGDGTMSHVPTRVYTRLVTDVLSLLVLPALEGCEAQPGGFKPIDWDVE